MAVRKKLSNNRKRKLEQLLVQAGTAALQQGEVDGCLMICRELDGIWPDYGDTLHLRGLVALQQGDAEQAIGCMERAVEAMPLRADLLAGLGNAHLQAGQREQATACFRQALALDADDMAAQLGMAGVLMAEEEFAAVISLLESARKKRPGDAAVRTGLFHAYHAVGDYTAARRQLEAVIARDAGNADAHYGLAVLAVEQGALDDAKVSLIHALNTNPFHADAWVVLADLRRFTNEDEESAAMQHIYQQSVAGSDMRMKMAFALAKVRDDQGQYDAAFALLDEANGIRHEHTPFDTDQAVAALDAVVAQTNATVMADRQSQSHRPCLFVLGMPRSGTTLVEQILSAHPQVTALGENGHLAAAIAEVAADGVSPAELNSLTAEQCTAIGAGYLERIEQAAGDAACYCDKTLSHIGLVGLIHRALPQARFVHLRRNPLDTCLSIYKNNLQGEHFAYGFELSGLGRYYAAYHRLMAHWRAMLPAANFIELDYESLVHNQQGQTQALLQACGLEWHDSCMDFQHAEHAAHTASAVQVRRPLSAASIGGWRRYEQQLAPIHYLND